MFDAIDPIWIFYACLAGAVIAAADVVYSLTFTSSMYRKQMNRRLGLLVRQPDRVQAMVDLRRQRGLTAEGAYQLPLVWFNRLVVQSGMASGFSRMAIVAGVAGVFAFVGTLVWFDILYAIVAALFAGGVLPLLVLLYLRRRRQLKFTEQFAEAIDIIVRSLRAGHPVPAAIKMAAREMADPIGTEFGMAEDEITFGLDLESAMRNMQERVGQEDLPLFVASIAIQTSSGGNLTEILENLAAVVRLRTKMRRKIRALSAEGRISAIILSATPIALFLIVNWMTPGFYGDNWDHPYMKVGLGGACVWMAIGNLLMRKMINFRF